MKKKIIFLFSFIIVLGLCIICYDKPENVSAEECPTYTNVYMFTELTGYNYIDYAGENNETLTLTRQKSMTGLPNGATVDGYSVADDYSSDAERSSLGTWKTNFSNNELSEFWENYLEADSSGGTSTSGNTTYYVNTKYYNNNTSSNGTGTKISDISGITSSDLVDATVMPTNTLYEITAFGINGGNTTFNITREYDPNDVSAPNGLLSVDWGDDVFVSPAMYTISYQKCDDTGTTTPTEDDSTEDTVTTHTLKINYWYDEVGKEKVADSHVETLASGSSYSVDSPKIDGYTANKSTVSGTMGNKDIVVDVVYSAKTGEYAMGLIWFIGLAGLGYGIYYYNKANKMEKEEEL